MNQGIIRLLVLFLMTMAVEKSAAQSWDVGMLAGGAGYMGDLNPDKPYVMNNLAYGLFVARDFDGNWLLKLSVTHGKISAADSNSHNPAQIERNLSFFSPVTEISGRLEFNFFNYIPAVSRKRYTPYIFAGGGLVLFNPKARSPEGDVVELNPLGTEQSQLDIYGTYRKYAITVPFGAGIKYNVASVWSLGFELGYRTAFTDYLDDVSGRYPDFSRLDRNEENQLRLEMSDRSVLRNAPWTQRGDFRPRDSYFFTGITLTYTFLSRKCPPVR